MSVFEGSIAFGLPLLLGHALLRLAGVRFRDDRLGFAGWLFPVGALGVALEQFVGLALGAPATSVAHPIAIGAVIVAAWLVALRRVRRLATSVMADVVKTPDAPPASLVNRLAGALLVVLAFLPAAQSFVDHARRPIYEDDDASIWSFKAKILFEHGRFDSALATRLTEETGAHHLDYPLLNPLLQVWTMGRAGRLLDVEIRWPTFLWYASFIFIALAAFRRRAGPVVGSLLGVAIASSTRMRILGIGTKSDIIVALALLAALDMVLRVAEDRAGRRRWLGLLAVFVTILVWSKNEGLMLTAALAGGALLTFPRPILRHAWRWPGPLVLTVPIAVVIGQQLFNRTYGLTNDLMTGGAGRDDRSLVRMLIENFPDRAGLISRAFWEIATRWELTHGIVLLFIGLVVAFPRRALSPPLRAVALALATSYAGYFLVYVISFEDLPWHLSTSAPRVTLHLLPSMLLFAAALLGEMARPQRVSRTSD